MKYLDFYKVDLAYVDYLQKEEVKVKGKCHVPNLDYGKQQREKFMCGVVLQVKEIEYYVPVSSYKQKQLDNFLIKDVNGGVLGSLRFNYMFPIPKELISVRKISTEPDQKYKLLLLQELKYCVNNQDKIKTLAERTYRRVLLGKNKGLVANSCDFKLLEQKCIEYCIANNLSITSRQRFQAEYKGQCACRKYAAEDKELVAALQRDCKCMVLEQGNNGFNIAIHNNSITKADELQAAHQQGKTSEVGRKL